VPGVFNSNLSVSGFVLAEQEKALSIRQVMGNSYRDNDAAVRFGDSADGELGRRKKARLVLSLISVRYFRQDQTAPTRLFSSVVRCTKLASVHRRSPCPAGLLSF